MTTRGIATALPLVGAAFILYIGVGYLVAPYSMATGFGLPAWPHRDAVGFLNIKGVRDTVTGLTILALLIAGHRRALGIVMLTFTLIPVGDMLTVLTHHGKTTTAFGVHGVTAVLVALTGTLLLRDKAAVRA